MVQRLTHNISPEGRPEFIVGIIFPGGGFGISRTGIFILARHYTVEDFIETVQSRGYEQIMAYLADKERRRQEVLKRYEPAVEVKRLDRIKAITRQGFSSVIGGIKRVFKSIRMEPNQYRVQDKDWASVRELTKKVVADLGLELGERLDGK